MKTWITNIVVRYLLTNWRTTVAAVVGAAVKVVFGAQLAAKGISPEMLTAAILAVIGVLAGDASAAPKVAISSSAVRVVEPAPAPPPSSAKPYDPTSPTGGI